MIRIIRIVFIRQAIGVLQWKTSTSILFEALEWISTFLHLLGVWLHIHVL